MSTSPQTSGQRVIYVNLEQEPEITQEVRVRLCAVNEGLRLDLSSSSLQGFAIGWANSHSFLGMTAYHSYLSQLLAISILQFP